ncbi:MAG: T9SS type A sorting domain-containing protein [Bacteroidia bacterium]|nr:T9SS type A sorting domain-containing protein [Bacteroidia bacterium]
MKTKITILTAGALMWLTSMQSQTPCNNDLNGFVNYKNIAGTGSCLLKNGFEEKAAQTYNYSGPGKITGVRVYGNYPTFGYGGVALRVGIYNVDGSGKPTTSIATVNHTWWGFIDNANGFIDVTYPNGVSINNRFAITLQILNSFPYGDQFNLRYTGNGEGGLQDLASLAGTSTGNNWASAKNSFNKDGDFYLVPVMAHLNVPGFTTPVNCYAANALVSFSNTTQMTKDSMFNKIAFPNYSGSNQLYSWNFGDASALSNLANPTHAYTSGGNYVITLTSKIEGWAGTCTKTFSKSISVGLSATSTGISNVFCYGASTGSVSANGLAGSPNYSYNLNNGAWQSSSAFTGLSAGNYTIGVRDSKNCLATTSLALTQNAGMIFNSVITSNATCGNATGAIVTTATGGALPVQYKLDNGSYQAGGNFLSILAGTHSVTVTDANACSMSTLITVNDLGGPTMGAVNLSNVSCFGGNDGGITLSSTGGTGLKQYSINGGVTFQASASFSNVAAGTYLCVVKDNAGCTANANVTIAQGQALVVNATMIPALCNGSSNGQITISSAGGTGYHSYSINGITFQSGSAFSGLTAGQYTVYVKDVTNCVKTSTIILTQPAVLSNSLSSVAATCFGLSNGIIAAQANGGNGNYVYSLNGNEYLSTGTFTNLPAGTYTIAVKDNNNCTNISTITVTQPAAITTTVNSTNSTCTFANGSIMVIAAGGSGSGYQYSINGGTNYFTSGLFTPLAAGTQYIVVKDGTGCSTIVSGIIVDSNGPVIASSNQQNVSCNGGIDGGININTVTGGSGTLQYSIDGINWQLSTVFGNLQAGVYVVQVKDANGCTGTITKTITQPNLFLIVLSTASVSCFGSASGSATITASGGAGFLVYSINGTNIYQSGNVFNNLAAGSYYMVVKDAANCTGYTMFNIVQPPKIELATLGILNVSCNGASNGAIYTTAFGGLSPYLYSINGSNYNGLGSFTGLSGNLNYIVYVKDANNCVIMTPVYISEPAPLVLSPIVSNITCAGGNNGAISLNTSGGTAPYTFIWSNGSVLPSVFNLNSGTYSVAVKDFNGCVINSSFVLNQPSNALTINGLVTIATGASSGDGAIDITVNGGVGPYSFIWSNGATTEDLSALNPGTYMVIITDANGCSTSATYIIGNITSLSALQAINNAVNIYPNPAGELATINAEGMRIQKIEVLNLLGKVQIASLVENTLAKIDVSTLANGAYFVRVYLDNAVVIKKMNVTK